MTTLHKAARMLLETVEAAIEAGDWEVDGACDPDMDIVALRQALANEALDKMAENARELGLDYDAKQADEPEIVQRVKRFAGKTMRTARNPNITARECIELANWVVANTHPQPSDWVSLTDEEIDACWDGPLSAYQRQHIRDIEQALKDKNGGQQ